ncbi:hypothetical protein CE91St36_06560 [Christensenellaceae bacterium]|nr:hypothetical protein CE91St36_06560 [Christensenellaceae bacterium]BDF60507.1 hypothetical protein CE91St37_06570 [Christensenellaceae bacterium]
MENSEIKMDLLVAIKPAKLHDLDYTEMQVALEQQITICCVNYS